MWMTRAPGLVTFRTGLRAAALVAATVTALTPVVGGCAARLSQIEQGHAISTGKRSPYEYRHIRLSQREQKEPWYLKLIWQAHLLEGDGDLPAVRRFRSKQLDHVGFSSLPSSACCRGRGE